ncbi:MAG: hypothetical protein ACTHNN_19455 [Xanthobacteraceae bacterium]
MLLFQNFLEAIKPWQTLIGSLIAIAAALVAVWNTTRTLKNGRELEAFRRCKKRDAIRSVLPLALSEISDYAESCADALSPLEGKCDEGLLHHHDVSAPELPPLPTSSIQVFSEFIEFADEIDVSVVTRLVGKVQILQARLRSLRTKILQQSEVTGESTIQDLIVDTAILYAYASACYDYGRGKVATMPTTIDWAGVRSALNNMGYWDFELPDIHKLIDQYQESGAVPE